MGPRHWRQSTIPAIIGLTAGAVVIVTVGSPQLIGVALFTAALAALCLAKVKKWATDTSFEKERLRITILNTEDVGRQAQVGHALQLAERERDRRLMDEARQDAERKVRAAEERAEQSEINTSMRAHAFEAGCEKRTAAAIAEAEQRADDRIAAELAALAKERSQLMINQYMQGVLDQRNGLLDAMLGDSEGPKLIHLDDHRRQPPNTKAADSGGPR